MAKKSRAKKTPRRVQKKKTQKSRPFRSHKKKPTPSSRKPKEYFSINSSFEFYDELRTLILKSSPDEKNRMIRKISGLGRVKLAVISGIFLANLDSALQTDTTADLFIVAEDINRRKLNLFLKELEADMGSEIKFGLMEKEEFMYRYGMFDRFVRVLLEGPHEKIINRLGI